MKTKEIVENLFTYIQANRRIGNTTLLIEGAKSYNNPFYVLGWSTQDASQKIKQYGLELAKPLSISNLDSARGTNLPLAIDADVVGYLLGEILSENSPRVPTNYFDVCKELHATLKTKNNRGDLLKKIGKMPWWERIFLAPRLIHQLFQLELKNN